MMAKVSAEDVAYEIGLAADELSKPCDSNIIPSLSDCFREWRVTFGSLLGDLDLGDVDRDNTKEGEKRIAALRKWRDRNGCGATYKVLVDALLNGGERYQAENLCHKILADHSMSDKNGTTTTDCDAKESESDIQFQCPCGECSLETYLQEGCPKSCIPYLGMTTLSKEDRENLNFILKKDTKKIIRSFENLSNGICDSLKRQEVTVDHLVRVAVNSNSSLHDKLIKSTSVDRVFTDLAPEMSFFNHETLTRIINVLGDEDDKEHLAHYSKEFQEFCKRKVFEIEPGPCTCGQHLSKLKQRKPFAVVLPTGEKRLQNLEDAMSIKETLADVLGVPLATLYLHRIDKGCIILVFSVPDSIAQELFPLPKKKLALLRAKGMVLFVPQDFTYESNQVEDATKPLAWSGDMHEASSEHPPTVPSGTPGELLVSHSLPTSAQLSWIPVPEDKWNDTIIGYTVQVKGPDSTQEIPVMDGNATSYEVSDLRPYTTYIFGVSAMTEAGAGPPIRIFSTTPQGVAMATVADQKLVVDDKLKTTQYRTVSSTTKQAQRDLVKPYSGRVTRSMTRGGYVKKTSQRAGSSACRSQTQKRVAEMLGLQLMTPPSAPTTRQMKSMTREVHIRKLSSDHAAGNSDHQTRKHVGEMPVLFKTVPTKSILYEEQADLIATCFQHDSMINNRPITAEEKTRLLQLVCEDRANHPMIECQCKVHKNIASIEPSFATHLRKIASSAAQLGGKMRSGNLTNCAVQLLELVFSPDRKLDIMVCPEGTSAAAHSGTKVVYEIGIGEETICVEATPDFYARTPDEYINLLIGECQSSGSKDPIVQLAIATLGQFADDRFVHPAKKLAACLFTKAKTASVFLGEELGRRDEKIYVSFSKVNRECAFNLTSKDDIKGFADTINAVIDLVLSKPNN